MHENNSTRPCLFLVYKPQSNRLARDAYIAAAAINCITMFPAIILNVLLMRAMSRSPALRKPSTLLLYSVSASDLLLGLIVQPGYLAKKVGELTDNFHIYCKSAMLTYVVGNSLTAVSLLNLTAIAIDRYLVVTSGIHYPRKVTKCRLFVIIAFIWTFAISIALGQIVIKRFLVLLSTLCYTKAMYTIKRQQTLMNAATRNNARTERYRKSIVTMVTVFIIFILSYTPFCVSVVMVAAMGESAKSWSAEALCSVIAFTNACMNPVILFWRISEIRNAGRQLLAGLSLHTGRAEESHSESMGGMSRVRMPAKTSTGV
ncbi:histamine H2 receptor [Nematostella vectensis]|uniref:histamine H2 receptor n=1 Tax=Nematostella vectensis TaxID=45351 RepID=UPI0020774A45|nr:histamine H2 receptor [Nematostella vectensis]